MEGYSNDFYLNEERTGFVLNNYFFSVVCVEWEKEGGEL